MLVSSINPSAAGAGDRSPERRAGRPSYGRRTAVCVGAVALAILGWCSSAAAPTEPHRALSLAWVGDIAFNSASGLPAGGPERALAPVRDLLASDFTMGNLEGTLGSSGTTKCHGQPNCFAFQAPASYAGAFQRLGFSLFNQANNHAADAGPGGIGNTYAALRRAGILRAGIGPS